MMTLIDYIRRAMPEHTTEVRMTFQTWSELRVERDANKSFDYRKTEEGSGATFAGVPVVTDDAAGPCTVVFVTKGRNYRFGWTI